MKIDENKILVTGMALGLDPDVDACHKCNYDLHWLYDYPSTLLWTDKIILTPEIYSFIMQEERTTKPDQENEATRLIFQILEDMKMLEINRVSTAISKELADAIYYKIILDKEELKKRNDPNLRFTPEGEIPIKLFIGDTDYCGQILWSIYASLLLAYKWNANILFTDYARKYLSLKYFVSNKDSHLLPISKLSSLSEIFSVILPESSLIPSIVFGNPNCLSCANKQECNTDYLKIAEKNMLQIMEWRSYDELHSLRNFVQKITDQIEKNDELTFNDLSKMFKDEKNKISRKIKSVFPKIERWTKVISSISAPITVFGIASNSPLVASIGAGAYGIGTVLDNYIAIQRSKYKWLGFYNESYNQS